MDTAAEVVDSTILPPRRGGHEEVGTIGQAEVEQSRRGSPRHSQVEADWRPLVLVVMLIAEC